jgi:translation elongation factor EF-1beta
MMDINKYILSQIKNDEKILKLVEKQQEKQPTKVIKHESKQKPNSFLLDLINENIRNEKRLTAHYKSIATGLPVVQEDDNIRLISNSNESLDSNLENQFNFVMSKYLKNQSQIEQVKSNLSPNMLGELVHNFSYYEPQIRQYRGQYVNDKLFADKLRNMLLKNVNLKYPATIALNNAMDASNEPDIEMQKAFEAKNQAVNEPINEDETNTTNNLQMIQNMITYIGKNQKSCSVKFELSTVVTELLKNYIKFERFDQLRELLTELSNTDQNSFDLLYADIEGIYTGTIYHTKNKDITAFVNNPKQQSQSFRTFLIKFAMEDYKRKFAGATNKPTFYTTFREYFKSKTAVALDAKAQVELKDTKFHALSNIQIIELIDEILTATVGDMSTLPETKQGHGLKPSEKVIHRKYFIDTHKLNNNILEVRYNKNRHLTNVKTQVIGHGVKNIIHSIINNDDMNQNDYHVLTASEQHLIRTILHMLDKAHLLSNADEEFNERFQILLSEYNAGNNSEILRNQIKQYILHAMKLNMIGRQAGQQMIIEMCF